jgi:hypothetical protein
LLLAVGSAATAPARPTSFQNEEDIAMRINVVLTIAGVGAASLLGALSLASRGTRGLWIPYFPCTPQVVYETSSCGWSGPECPSDDQISALSGVLVHGDPFPPGFTMTYRVERETARTTGAVDWLGRHEIEVTVRASTDALASASLYLDDRLVSEANDENGCVFRYGDDAEAVLSFFVPWVPPYTVELVTRASDGKESKSSIAVGRSSRSRK